MQLPVIQEIQTVYQWYAILGAGGLLAFLMFMFYRYDEKAARERFDTMNEKWATEFTALHKQYYDEANRRFHENKQTSDNLVRIIENNTRALVAMEGVVDRCGIKKVT